MAEAELNLNVEQELNAEQMSDNEADEAPKDQYLIFSVDEECFGIDINFVREIIGMEPVTAVPDLPDYIKGVINLRGKVVPVMDMLIRFQKPPRAYTDRTCIVVVEIENIFMGLIIDEVLEVISIMEEEIMSLPKGGKESITNRYAWGVVRSSDGVRMLLDGKKLIEKEEQKKEREKI